MVAPAGAGALAADHLGPAAPRVVDDHRHVAARPVQMRLDHLQREGGRDAGVEGVAAALQHRHADRGRDPVRRGDDAEGAVDFRTGGEAARIDEAHDDREGRSGRMYASTLTARGGRSTAIFDGVLTPEPTVSTSRIYGVAQVTTAKVFKSGNSQAVRLPKEFRFASDEVEIFRRGDEVVLREKPQDLLMEAGLMLGLAARRRLYGPGRSRGRPPQVRNG